MAMRHGREPCIKPSRSIQALVTLALAAAALAWLTLILVPAPVIIESREGSGQVYFSANRGVVMWPGDCVTLRWEVNGIKAIYLNDEAQTGSGEKPFCSTPAVLQVVFADDVTRIYPLNITILATSPLSVFLVALILITGVLHRQRLRLFRPRQWLVLLIISVCGVYLFLEKMLPLSQTVASSHWLEASEALAALIGIDTLLAFLVLVAARGAFEAGDTGIGSMRKMLAWWGGGLLLAFIAVSGTIVAVNPRGMYPVRTISHQLLLRDLKTEGYQQLAQPPDIVIMGSSRAFTLSPAAIAEQTGRTAYNMAVEGGRIEDVLIQARQMETLPEVMLIEVQEGLPRQPNDIAARAPLKWLPAMSPQTALLTLQKRLEGLVDLSHFAEALYMARYAEIYRRQPKEWATFEPDGFVHRPLIEAAALEQALAIDIGGIPPLRCDGVDEQSQRDTEALITMSQSSVSLVFYISPWHPRYYEAVLAQDADYEACHAAFTTYMQALAETHEGVFFLDYSRLSRIDGLENEAGYYDSQHMTEANSRRLIQHAAETLRAAYQFAAGNG